MLAKEQLKRNKKVRKDLTIFSMKYETFVEKKEKKSNKNYT